MGLPHLHVSECASHACFPSSTWISNFVNRAGRFAKRRFVTLDSNTPPTLALLLRKKNRHMRVNSPSTCILGSPGAVVLTLLCLRRLTAYNPVKVNEYSSTRLD